MSEELKDFRGKLTAEAHCALEAESRATGRERQEIVRAILHEWAINRIHGANVLHRLLQVEGLPGIDQGGSGNRRE